MWKTSATKAAATATGTRLTPEILGGYKNMINNLAMAHRYARHCEAFGVKAPDAPPDMPTGSTDMGDVSHAHFSLVSLYHGRIRTSPRTHSAGSGIVDPLRQLACDAHDRGQRFLGEIECAIDGDAQLAAHILKNGDRGRLGTLDGFNCELRHLGDEPDSGFLEFLGSVDRLSDVNSDYIAQAEARAKAAAANPPANPPPPRPPAPPPNAANGPEGHKNE